MYIDNIVIENIRSIKIFKMDFSNPTGWHVLIGDNGAGKSSILKALALVLIGPSEALSLRLNLNNYINFKEQEARVALKVQRHDIDRFAGKSPPLKRPFDAGIKISRNNGSRITIARIDSLKPYKYAKKYLWSNRDGWFSASFGPFRRFTGGNKDWEKVYYANPKAAAHLSVFGEDVALTESLEWLTELNYKSLEQDKQSELLLKNLMTFINEGELLPHGAVITAVSSEGVFIKDGNNESVAVTEMSDGFRSILSMTFEIIRQMVNNFGAEKVFQAVNAGNIQIDIQGVVLIDEIDAHLHPTWQTRIGKWFTRYFPNIQFIVTTHSPLVCRACEHGSIWRLAAPGSSMEQGEITGIEKERLIYGNILDAYGTELFGASPVRSASSDEKKKKLGRLDMLFALNKITDVEKKERLELQKILTTDAPTGY